jgi:hypothetical protein
MLVYDERLDAKRETTNELYATEPTNEEIFYSKANIYSKRDQHDGSGWIIKLL